MRFENKISFEIFDRFEKEFSFIMNGKIYKTNSFVPNILTPYVSDVLEENMNIPFYQINTKYNGDFNEVIKYGEMEPIIINQNERHFFVNVIKQLGNNNEIFQYCQELEGNISYENII